MLGLSASSQAGLINEISKLGTNLLTVANGQTLGGDTAELPVAAPGMISRIAPVTAVDDTGTVSNVNAYRSPLIPSINTNALSVQATSLRLPHTVGTSVAQGRFLNAATAREPVAVLGAAAAGRMGIDRIYPGERIWVGGQWFYLVGILHPAVLAPEIDTSVLIGYPAAQNTSASTGTRPRSTCAPRPTRSTPSTTCSPPPPTPNTPTRSTSPSPPTRWSPKPTPKAR